MGIETFRLGNFRSILDSGELRLRPLTVLVGPNEAGKSSLLQALALLKQSAEVAAAGLPLMEDGRLVELGSFRQFIYLHETSRPLTYQLGLGMEGGTTPRLTCALDFSYSIRRKRVYLRRFEMGEPDSTPWLSVRADGSGKVEHAETAEPAGSAAEPRILGRIERSAGLYRVAPAWDRWGDAAGRPITECAHSPEFYARTASGTGAVQRFLEGLAYIGPDRAAVPVVLPITGQLCSDVGCRGENAAAMLHAHRYADEAAPGVSYVAERLERMGVGRHLRVVPIEEHLYEITIEDPQTGLVMALGEAGRAARQLFPFLVQSYLAAPDATLLLEEPEAHLHPRLQAEMADLLIETIRGGRRLLVETYSEPLLARLQQRVREGTLPAEDLGVYFVQKTDGDTQFSELAVEPDGTLRDAPADLWISQSAQRQPDAGNSLDAP
jgi:predicted ATPase